MAFNPSKLTINTVKKFVDRIEKSYAKRGAVAKRTEVQEDVAHMLGFSSYHDLTQHVSTKQPKTELADGVTTSAVDLLVSTSPENHRGSGPYSAISVVDLLTPLDSDQSKQKTKEPAGTSVVDLLVSAKPWQELLTQTRRFYCEGLNAPSEQRPQRNKDYIKHFPNLSAERRDILEDILSGQEFLHMCSDYNSIVIPKLAQSIEHRRNKPVPQVSKNTL